MLNKKTIRRPGVINTFIKHNETNPYTRFVHIYILGAKI